jgi:flagellar biosynthesis repressor protein FlbT
VALKITVKPHEKLIIGGAVIANGSAKSELLIENNVPILRGKDIMSLHEADSPCKRIYFAIQLMYVDQENLVDHHKTYWELVRDVAEAAPSRRPVLQGISDNVLNRRYYQALKLTRSLIAYEQEVIEHVRSTTASI